MGLLITAKGFDKEIYDSDYMGFTKFRIALAKSYNEEFGTLYEKWLNTSIPFVLDRLTKEEYARFNELFPIALSRLLHHSDNGGKLTPKECKKIYDITKGLKCDYIQHNYLTNTGVNQLEVFNEA